MLDLVIEDCRCSCVVIWDGPSVVRDLSAYISVLGLAHGERGSE